MSRLKEQLIRLGASNPELRPHLRPVLDTITGSLRKSNVFQKAQRRYGPLENAWMDWVVPEPELQDLNDRMLRAIEDKLNRFTAREAKQAYDAATSAAYEVYRKHTGSVDEGELEEWYDQVEQATKRYLRAIFEELSHEASGSMADEYWNIAENIERRI